MRKFGLLGALLVLVLAGTALASTITNARYHGLATISSNGTGSVTVGTVNFTANTNAMIADGLLSSNTSDSAVRTGSTDIAYMPLSTVWWTFLPTIQNNTSSVLDIYTGGGTNMESKLVYIPGTSGMTWADNATLELGSNFTIEQRGWLDTTAGASKILISKTDAISIVVSPTTSGNLTLTMLSDVWVSPATSTITQSGLDDFNLAQTVDGNTGTNAFHTNTAAPGSYLTLDFGTARALIGWRYYTGNASLTTNWTIQYSSDNASWGMAYTGLSMDGAADWHTATWNYAGAYRYWRSYLASGNSPNYHTELAVLYGAGAMASGVSSGVHTIRVVGNGSFAFLSIDDVLIDTAVWLSTVADNANAWTAASGGAWRYLEFQKILVGGNLKQEIRYQYNTTAPYSFTDRSGNGQYATPTFPTVSTTNMTGTLNSFAPMTEAVITSYSITTAGTLLSTNPSTPSQLYTSGNFTNVPGADVANAFLDESGTPRALWWYPLIFGIIAVLSLLMYAPLSGGNRSTLGQHIITEACLVLLGVINPIPLIGAFLYPIAAAAIVTSETDKL